MEPGSEVLAPTSSFRAGDWFALVAGAVIAVGISATLTVFGAAIGLATLSTSPSWREGTSWLWLGSGLYLIFVALWAFGLGGYVAGRLRHPFRSDNKETEFRDGLHGVATWGLALTISAALAGAVALAGKPQGTSTAAASATTAEALIPGELDQLFRDARKPRDATFDYHRAEAGRILLQASSKRGVSTADRDYLTNLVVASTDLGVGEAMTRVDGTVANTTDALHSARVAAVIQAFMIAAGLALGAAIAWFAAVEGGKEREVSRVPQWSWTRRRVA